MCELFDWVVDGDLFVYGIDVEIVGVFLMVLFKVFLGV